ncbi:hypothetical protein AAV35_14100 [Salimicrobium jeotgali]|uniref:SCP domain-containing protein n=2 Tax=Salimicrobium TaxID=351195 RepID=K2H8X1_9BACI|nr:MULTISPECIES: CAP domain-containing protein [Salimicrobium]APC65561.1 hypothetical protein AAV35_14100 [Salimicrobium jeotgali]EKE32095.1 hypothetical protein MJ3_05728 [Salimicrobium jeotgali]MBM7696063.1 putative YkwD family protein [Salimicrobium jeotgali]
MHKYWISGLIMVLLGVVNPIKGETETLPGKEVPIDKAWTIEFTENVDEDILSSNNYVGIKREDGTFVPLERTIGEASIRLEPEEFYKDGETYELYLSPELRSETKTETARNFRAVYEVSAFEREVVELTNEKRAAYGLPPLELNEELSRVAKQKSFDMHENSYFAHQSPTYGSPFNMMNMFGLNYQYAGENIAAGQISPEEVVEAWMNSEGHRANILNENYDEIGVGYVDSDGYYVTYWTQFFYTSGE